MEDGWIGIQGVPSNNNFARMSWFHFDPTKKSSADVGVTKRLSDFIIRNADRNSGIFRTAAKLLERYKTDTRFIVHGYPNYDPESLKIWDYDPATYPTYFPLPAYFVGTTK